MISDKVRDIEMRLKFIISLLCILMALSTSGAGLIVSGALLQMDVAPGDHINHTVTLSLKEDEEPTEAVAGVFGHGMRLDGARVPTEDTPEMAPYSAAGFLTVSPETAEIKPGEPTVFIIEGTVPEDVGSGGRYALVNIATPPRGEGRIGIALAAIVPVVLTISGTELVHTGEISELNLSDEQVSVAFKNTGNHHFRASAEAVVEDDDGEVVASVTAPLMYTALIPAATWLFEMEIDYEGDLEPGTYTVEATVLNADGELLDTKEETFEIE